MTSRSIRRIFFAQGVVIGVVGTTLGLLLGLAAALALDKYKLIPLDPAVYFIDHLPVALEPLDMAVIVLASLVIAAVATLYPAHAGGAAVSGRGDPPRMRRSSRRRRCAKTFTRRRRRPDRRARRRRSAGRPGRDGGDRRRERRGQEHAAPPARRARPAPTGAVLLDGDPLDRDRTTTSWPRAQPQGRLRLPVPSPAARVHRAGERDDAAADRGMRRGSRGAPAPRSCSSGSGWAAHAPPARRSCRAASSSARRWRGRWRPTRRAAGRRAVGQPRPRTTASGCTSCSPSSRGPRDRRWWS